jgi:hypothetical protein
LEALARARWRRGVRGCARGSFNARTRGDQHPPHAHLRAAAAAAAAERLEPGLDGAQREHDDVGHALRRRLCGRDLGGADARQDVAVALVVDVRPDLRFGV